MKTYFHAFFGSPVGQLKLVASDAALVAILWRTGDYDSVERGHHPVLFEAQRQLGEYFAGRRTAFNLELDFVGTAFQRRVWSALLTIPYGETRSYGEIARQIGSPSASRAVGAANGSNPISIVAPCHRVVGSTGKLTGFGGGLEAKAKLLALESGAFSLRPMSSPARQDPGSHSMPR